MVYINYLGYLETQQRKGKHEGDWWIVRVKGNKGVVPVNDILLPKEYIGKRVRFKVQVEVLKQEE